MVDKIDLDLVGLFQSSVALNQGAFDLDGIGHVLERHQGRAVRQPHSAAIDDAAVDPLDAPQDRLPAVDRRHGSAQGLPSRAVGMEEAALLDDGLDMWMLIQHGGGEMPPFLLNRGIRTNRTSGEEWNS